VIRGAPSAAKRDFRTERLDADLVVAGGGLAGTCCAITAARAGARVVLVQDRPVLGGNCSSEVRLWVLGATSHMANNNRWSREGGVVDEILVENTFRNPEGNPVLVDTVLLEKAAAEPNLTLLLDTAVVDLEKSDPDTIASARAFCAQSQTAYDLRAPLFCDASGDGVLGYLAGAAFRMGAEGRDEFGEGFAPDRAYGELLGHSIYFYTVDAGRPVRFVPPSYALGMGEVEEIARYRRFDARTHGPQLWWIEYGGRLDTVHDTARIKWELWRVVYGLWNYVKNSGRFPDAENLTLSWVGTVPGKRESRRFEGDYVLVQQDVIEQRGHPDAVAFGGWSLDLHPADGVYARRPGCDQWHAKGIYDIPYRTMYSRNVTNLFLAGRLVSVSHVAFGSTRVMATCAYGGQAAGMAAALCARGGLRPRDLAAPERVGVLQRELMKAGQHIPGLRLDDPDDLARSAAVRASSRLRLAELPADGPWLALDDSWAMLLPAGAGAVPRVTFEVDASDTPNGTGGLRAELRTSERAGNFTPDVLLAERAVPLAPGGPREVTVDFGAALGAPAYVFVCLRAAPGVRVRLSEARVTGVLAVTNRFDAKVARSSRQEPPEGSGIPGFEFWRPLRRPAGQNLAVRLDPPLEAWDPERAVNGIERPTVEPNAWVADPADARPALTLVWPEPRRVGRVELAFDTDWDHAMETVLMGHPERAMPFCVRHYRVCDGGGRVLRERDDNYQTRNTVRFAEPVLTASLTVELLATHGGAPPALFGVRCYER
jgi:hypothetical protein